MKATIWISEAQRAGWRVQSSRNGVLDMHCNKQGCPGAFSLPLNNLGQLPEACDLEHVGQYGLATYELYTDLVSELRRRRRTLGLSIEDVNAASGLADAHVNKLESMARTAQFPTLQLWAETLGAKITLTPAPLPEATMRAIEQRVAQPFAEHQVRTKRPAEPTKAITYDQ